MKTLECSTTTAIPKEVTDLHYKRAVQRLIHAKQSNLKPTRHTYIVDRISKNIKAFNNPVGNQLPDPSLSVTLSRLGTFATSSPGQFKTELKNREADIVPYHIGSSYSSVLNRGAEVFKERSDH